MYLFQQRKTKVLQNIIIMSKDLQEYLQIGRIYNHNYKFRRNLPLTRKTKVYMIAISTTLVIVLSIIIYNFHKAQMEHVYSDTREQLISHAIVFRTVIEEKIAALKGMAAFINTVGMNADSDVIMNYLRDLHTSIPEAKALIIAPMGIIKYIYPLEGNEELLGENYLTSTELASRGSIKLTLESSDIVIDGPRELFQGGKGIISRQALYAGDRFQGIITLTIDFDSILAPSKAFLEQHPSFAIRDEQNTILFGPADTFTQENVRTQIAIQNKLWDIAIVPDKSAIQQVWLNSFLIATLGLSTIIATNIILYRQRKLNEYLNKLVRRKTEALHKANKELLMAEGELRLRNELLERRTKELEESEQKYEQLAYSDSLTGISNRLHFTKYLETAILHCQNQAHQIALFFMDLNKFKEVNDTLGHPIGDKLLYSIAGRIKNSGIPYDHFARPGGDEFILVFAPVKNIMEVEQYANSVLKLFEKPFYVNGLELNVSTSIGISLYPTDSNSAEEMMQHADLAMYAAKTQGENQFRIFDHSMLNQLLAKKEMVEDLSRAITQNELMLYYQPVIDVNTKKIVGLEALLRWKHPTKGMISPATFIPLAEETGQIIALTDWVLHEAFRQHQEWLKEGLPSVKISINFSNLWFFRNNREQDFYHLLHQYGMDSNFVEIEITERVALMDDYYPILERMLSVGISVAVDDFGIEYSSLNYLKRFPVNKIKIDKSFISGIGKDQVDETIIDAIVFVAKSLNYTVVAEGVETEEQLKYLQDHGCQYVQGYYFYPPLSPENLAPILKTQLQDLGTV